MTSPAATILIVDDEPHNRKLLETLLAPEGYVTTTAVNGEDALASIARKAPDLILLDIMMPGMDGYQVAGKLKADPATAGIPIIMVTASVDRGAHLAGLNAGAEEFLTKPVDRAELWVRVRNLLRLKAFTDFLRNHSAILEKQVQDRTESLQASESRFLQMAENIRDVFFLKDAGTNRMLYVSPAYEEIWGRSCESLYANPESWTDAIHPDDLSATIEKYKNGLPTGKYVVEYRILRPDGSIRWIQTRDFAVRDDSGRIVRIAGIAEDITEDRRVAAELRESERRFSDMLKNVELISVMLDPDALITYCNPYLLRLTGWRRENVIGRNWFELFIPPESNDSRDVHAALLADKPEGRHHENEILTRAGERRLIRWNNSVLRGDIDDVIGTASIGEDITAQRQGEIKIKRLNRVYAVLSEINALIVRARGREELFREASRIAVEQGGFCMAWIGITDRKAGLIKPVASAGDVRDFFESAPLELLENKPADSGLAGQAVATMKPVVLNDAANNPRSLMRKQTAERGINSLAIIPLIVEDEAKGVLALYSADEEFFDEEEMRLLQGLAGDLSSAINHIEKTGKLDRMTRVNSMLSRINGAIVRIRDRQELFEEACRIAVETGRLPFAWLGLVDEAEMQLRPVAFAGGDNSFLEMIRNRLSLRDDAPEGHGIGAKAVREKRVLVVNDVETNADLKYKKGHADRGIKSVAALPLIIAGRVIGAFSLHASEVGFFDDEEIKLLNEVANNIAFAVEHIEKEEKVQRLTRVYAVLSGINTLIVRVRDRDELFRETCRIAVEQGGFRLAWIGTVDQGAMKIVPVASAGENAGFLEEIRERMSLLDDAPTGHGPPTLAARGKQAIVVNDVRTDPRIRYPKAHVDRGIGSLVVLPVLIAKEPVAVLGLHAAEAGYFDEAEMGLLRELAGDVAFAIDNIEKAEKLGRITRVNAMLSGINAAIVRIRESEELFREVCRIAVSDGGFILARVVELDSNRMASIAATSESDSRQFQRLLDDYNGALERTQSRNLFELAVRSGRPEISNDVASDPRITSATTLTMNGTYALAVMPIVVEKCLVGTVVLRAREAGMFNEEELRLLLEVISNISFALELMDKNKKLDYLAYYDALTGLANRRLFLERVAQYIRTAADGGHKLAVGLIDLERFKNINDSLGQPAGDELLKQVAAWLTRSLGDANLLARVGADHFAVVLPEARSDGNVTRLVEKTINAFLEHPFRLNDAVFRIAAKVGVALFPDDGTDADVLLKNAEAALKKSKASGDRYLFHTEKMTGMVASKLALENQLRQALDKEEFVLHYQPKVNLVSGKLTGVEALIRWNDPRTGLVPPGQFIPLLEETGLIYDVGRWALGKAIKDYLRWRAAGLAAVRVAVNVSPLQLRNRGFTAEIEQAIGIDPHAAAGLELEITESLIMEDVKHNIASLEAIRAMGIRIAIDDFGTGFSSLAYLAKLPVDTLKIDRSFVIDMADGPEGLALVSTIINLAHSLKLKVVAEGVETEEQLRLLRLLDCDEMQGYLFSKPVPSKILEEKYLNLRSVLQAAGGVAVDPV